MNLLASLLSLFLLGTILALGVEPTNEVFRIGVSYASFGTVNRNDASAALKAYAASVVRERKLQVGVQVDVMENLVEFKKQLDDRTLCAASMTIEEYLQLGVHPKFVFVVSKSTGSGEQYVILARQDGQMENLRSLRGRRLVRHVSTTTIPALPWMETMLAQQGLGRAKDFFSEISELDSPSKTVLRVFFRQSDACLVTTNAYALACELNPQLSSQLKVLSASPMLIPTIMYFQEDSKSLVLPELETAISELHKSTVGQQVLTVFQSSHMERLPSSCLETTLRLYEDYARLVGQTNNAAPTERISATVSQQ